MPNLPDVELVQILPDARMLFQKLPARKHRGSSTAASRPILQEFDCSAEESKMLHNETLETEHAQK